MIIQLFKHHKRHSARCTASWRCEKITEAQSITVSAPNLYRGEEKVGRSELYLGDYRLEMDIEALKALHARLGGILAAK